MVAAVMMWGMVAAAGLADVKQAVVFARPQGSVDLLVLSKVEQLAHQAAVEQLKQRVLAPADAPDPEEEKAREQGSVFMAQAREAANNLETDRALELAEAALIQLQSAATTLEDIKKLAECHLLLFRASMWNERPQDAQEHMLAAYALYPDLKVNDDNASADEIALYRRTTAEARRQPKGVLALVSNPPGAAVRVDGKDHGPAPVTLREVLPGRHVVRFSMPWRQPVLLTAVVPPGGEGRAQASLVEREEVSRARGQLSSNELEATAGDWKPTLRSLGADHAVVVAVESPASDQANLSVTAHVYRLSDGRRLRRVQAKVDAIKLQAGIQALVQDALALDKGPGTPGGARFQDAAFRADNAAQGGGGLPGFVPWAVLAVALPTVAVVSVAGGFALGVVVTGVWAQAQLAQQTQASRRAARRGQAARQTTLGY